MQTLSRPWEAGGIPYVKKKKTLPKVFSFKEVISILKNTANLKHKVLIALIYSTGLRLSESVNLKLTDIKIDTKRILVRQGKGAKDRYTILSDICLKYLEIYWKQYKPDNWLFSGYKRDSHLSPRACQHAFTLAKKRAGIIKEEPKSLAELMLELTGTDIRKCPECGKGFMVKTKDLPAQRYRPPPEKIA